MAFDLYAGSLTRYLSGDWKTAEQLRADPETAPGGFDGQELERTLIWQASLLTELGGGEPWAERSDLTYWTSSPRAAGVGGLQLLAAYQEQPDLMPKKGGLFSRRKPTDDPLDPGASAAFQAATAAPTRYATLLSGVQWWLPISGVPAVFSAKAPDGRTVTMGTVTGLRIELANLATALGMNEAMLNIMSSDEPDMTDLVAAGTYGLALFIDIAKVADDNRQPLVLDV
ncbi:hypothetical protein G7070_07070 [Propioniciclava coleopterorum]|uniref:Uncharacterized protein n=1 Tax=Propioniciclava coleopterorum TaxID=2714937 RepID=A0A6G7Y5H2_9ACTN|nr:hypothetical protein [Propioniciclava coleopterorum]QIK72072.1 hypothetical protein G7070_07070 [Propioniciclava coleopterorum]